MKLFRSFLISALLTAAAVIPAAAQSTGSIGGSVTDSLGAIVVGASITVVGPTGAQKTAVTNARGEYSVTGLTPGKYTVKAIAKNFGLYENTEVEVTAGEKSDLIVVLTVAGVQENVEVSNDNTVNNDPDNNASATVIKGKDLDALPDDPDELESALQALAGPSAGPNGGQIYIDGFTGGNLPPKDSIREIRINQNPFSAEFDRLGFGRIEILTKPGTDKWRGSVFGNFNDARLNSRNPFAANRAPSQTRFFGGNISGPIVKKKASFFVDISNRDIDNNTVINALVLDPALNIVDFRQDVRVPTKRFSIGPRLDLAINDRNTLVARYEYNRSSFQNQGIGDTGLFSRAYSTRNVGHEIRLTETSILNSKTVNETRFEYNINDRSQTGDNSIPTISVASAFVGGGASIGQSYNRSKSWELNNFTTTSLGKANQHSIKFGVRIRNASIQDRSENNYAGTFAFTGFIGADPYDLDGDGRVSPIEQYRAKLAGAVGTRYDPNQFTITAGDPLAKVSQTDVGVFVTDDWRISPAFLLSAGLRYENQTNIHSNLNFAPRVSFAWSPGAGGAKAPKTVIRGGAGIFYDRFSDSYTLNAYRFNGSRQLSYVVSSNDPVGNALLTQPIFTQNGVTNPLTAAQIGAVLPGSSTIRRISPDLTAPYTIQWVLGVERQLPMKTTLSFNYIGSRSLFQLRARNINAPICPAQGDCGNAPRPDMTLGPVYQYESSGFSNSQQFIVNFRSNFNARVSLFGNYRLGFTKSDTDGGGSFPAYSYDMTGEYGRAGGDIRHFFIVGGNINLPWAVSMSPFITASSGRPFNITSGIDTNHDLLYTERPTYGAVATRCSELHLTYAFCNIGTNDPNATIPRNYGEGPGSFTMNLRLSKNIGFGRVAGQAADNGGGGGNRGGGNRGGGGGGNRGGGMMAGGMRGGGGGPFGGGDARKPYNLNIGVNFSNLLNTVNLGTPVGNLSSTRFGQSTQIAGGFGGFMGGGGGSGAANRRVELQLRFSW